MKFAKIAKDKAGKVLNVGDILLYPGSDVPIHSVITEILQRNRDEFPTLRVTSICTDWRGKVTKTQRSTLTFETYKTSHVVDLSLMRNDNPMTHKLKEIQEPLLTKALNKLKK